MNKLKNDHDYYIVPLCYCVIENKQMVKQNNVPFFNHKWYRSWSKDGTQLWVEYNISKVNITGGKSWEQIQLLNYMTVFKTSYSIHNVLTKSSV